jgi:hypothetical protein
VRGSNDRDRSRDRGRHEQRPRAGSRENAESGAALCCKHCGHFNHGPGDCEYRKFNHPHCNMEGEWIGSRSHQTMQKVHQHALRKGFVARYVDNEWRLCKHIK